MGSRFAKTMFSPAAKLLQEEHHSRAQYERLAALGPRDEALGDFEQQFIAARDSFYLGSVNEDGWPYIQHRGGSPGFLHALDGRTLAFADFAGNKQYITAGNLATNDRVALFLMDYPNQARLKIIGHARIVGIGEDPALEAKLRQPDSRATIERIFVIEVVAYDWNCSQHITRRFTEEEFARGI
jgi:predicted pyridoxine 5'-phosphate oxidase superfamily flavin-nucleotide-binding protein